MTNPHLETKRSLAMAVDALAQQQHLLDVQERLYTLWLEASDDAQRWESERPRRSAEARLAHHIDTDTLDLY